MALQSQRLLISKDEYDLCLVLVFYISAPTFIKRWRDGKSSRTGFQSSVTCIFLNQHSSEPRNPGIWVYKDIESELHWDSLGLHCVRDIIWSLRAHQYCGI